LKRGHRVTGNGCFWDGKT